MAWVTSYMNKLSESTFYIGLILLKNAFRKQVKITKPKPLAIIKYAD